MQWVRVAHSHNRHRSDVSVRQHATADQVRQWLACRAPLWAQCDSARDSCSARGTPPRTAAVPLDATVVRLEPRAYGLADVPRGIVPHHQQRRLPFSRQPVRQPPKKLRRHRTNRTTVHKAEEHVVCVSSSQPITRHGLGLWVATVRLVLDEAQRLGVCPGRQVGLGETAPPDLVLQAYDPVGMPQRLRNQAITPLFFRA